MNINLYQFLSKVAASLELPRGSNMRCSLWSPDDESNVKQATNYWPSNIGPGGAGKINTTQGLVGRSFRRRSAEVFLIPSDATVDMHRQALVDMLGFKPEQAAHVNIKQKSRLALPVVRDDRVCGVFYCDTSTDYLFDGARFDPAWVHHAIALLSILEPIFGSISCPNDLEADEYGKALSLPAQFESIGRTYSANGWSVVSNGVGLLCSMPIGPVPSENRLREAWSEFEQVI